MNAALSKRKGELRGWHVLALLLAFFSAVVVVNVAFAVFAAQSFPGEDVRRSYLQGLAYNDTLADRRKQAALGWRAGASFEGETIRIRIVDSTGAGVPGLSLEGALRRPLDARMDVPLAFADRGDGDYVAQFQGLPAGAWELRARTRGGVEFSLAKRLTWPPSQLP